MDISYYKKYEPIFGSWHIVREIGEGSFGKVFEIKREDFGHTYKAALKAITIPQSESEIKSAMAEGLDEASVSSYFRGIVQDMVDEFVFMSKLKGHSNIVSYEDHMVIPHKDGLGWDILIRMELLTPMLDYMRTVQFGAERIIKLGTDMCKALEHCGKLNIIHRDIKPENIFVSEFGDFKLGDFGVARVAEEAMENMSRKGTYNYMAPEVYKGEPYGADVDTYSLGLMLFRLLNNNRAPFLPEPPAPIKMTDREAALTRRMKGEAIPAPANADKALAKIILKACAYNPKDRYASPMEMREALESLVDKHPAAEKETEEIFSAEAVRDHEENNDKTVSIFNKPKPERSTQKNVEPTIDASKLLDAIREGNVSEVSRLLALGANPNCERVLENGNRFSALVESISDWPNDEIAKILVEAGADVNYIGRLDDGTWPVLISTIFSGNTEMVKLLLSKGADPNIERVFDDGRHYSALRDSINTWPNDEIAKMLIDAGADVNYIQRAAGGVIAPVLIDAIVVGNVGMAALLLSKGADPNGERVFDSGSHYSALRDSIVEWPNMKIVDLLCSYMNVMPDDVKGLKLKKKDLSRQTVQKLKAAGCEIKMF